MQPPKDFTNKVDAPSSIAEYVTNISSSGVESHHLRRHEADEEDEEPRCGAQDAQYQNTFGLVVGIPVGRDPQYPCINDSVTNHGICRSNEKVFQQGAKCIACVVSAFLV